MFFFVALTLLAASSIDANALSTKEMAALLIERNSQLKKAKLDLELQNLDRLNRRAKFYPALNFETSVGLDATSAGPTNPFSTSNSNTAVSTYGNSNPWVSRYKFTASETLLSGDNNSWTLKVGDLNVELAELNYRLARDQLLFQLIKKICAYLDLEAQIAIKVQELKFVSAEFGIIQHSYNQGLKSYSDYLRFKGRYFNAKLAVENLETQRDQGLDDIRVLLEEPSITDVRDDLRALENDVKFEEQTLAQKIRDRQADLGQWQVNALKAKNPWELIFSLGASYSQDNYLGGWNYLQTQGPWESTGLITFKWTIWDWGISRRALESERIKQDQSIADKESTLVQTAGRVRQIAKDVARLKSQLKTQAEIIRIEDENLKQQTINYRNGKASFLDYSDALTNYGLAKQTYRSSELSLKQFRSEILSIQGILYDQLIAQ